MRASQTPAPPSPRCPRDIQSGLGVLLCLSHCHPARSRSRSAVGHRPLPLKPLAYPQQPLQAVPEQSWDKGLQRSEPTARASRPDPAPQQPPCLPAPGPCSPHTPPHGSGARGAAGARAVSHGVPLSQVNVDPEDLIPKLPKPRDLQPFPTTQALVNQCAAGGGRGGRVGARWQQDAQGGPGGHGMPAHPYPPYWALLPPPCRGERPGPAARVRQDGVGTVVGGQSRGSAPRKKRGPGSGPEAGSVAHR